MLHILALPHLHQALVDRIRAGDAVLLQRGSVWALLPGHEQHPYLQALLAKSCRVYVLEPWLAVNGLSNVTLPSGLQVIDHSGWVALTVEHEVIQTWN